MPKLSLILARARNGVIGRDNALPWRLPEDLAFFRQTTMGHPVVMGRRTWESIGRPLPGRRNVVVTRTAGWRADGAEVARSLDEAIALCGDVSDIFVIGGAALFAAALPVADAIVATEIDQDIEGDTVFPPIDDDLWIEVSRESRPSVGLDTPPFAFVHYARRKP